MPKNFYAEHNVDADTVKGSRGFLNSWVVSRFAGKAERDAFVGDMAHKLARPVTRKGAIASYANQFLCVGDKVPAGGLFGSDGVRGAIPNFWNERHAYFDAAA